MKAILIDPKERSITEVEYHDGNLEEIVDLLDCRLIDFVQTYINGDGLYIDDEGMLIEDQYFFKHINSDYPLAGKALVIGIGEQGETIAPLCSVEDLEDHITFLGHRRNVQLMYAKTAGSA